MGAPCDEYEPEAARIAAQMQTVSAVTVETAFRIVQFVWTEMFGPFNETELQRREQALSRVAHRMAGEL